MFYVIEFLTVGAWGQFFYFFEDPIEIGNIIKPAHIGNLRYAIVHPR